MKKEWSWLSDEVALKYAPPLAAFLLGLLILLTLRHVVMKWFRARSHAEHGFLYIVLETLRIPSILWCIAAAVQVALETSIIPVKYTGRASNAILAFLIASICIVLASATVRALTMQG